MAAPPQEEPPIAPARFTHRGRRARRVLGPLAAVLVEQVGDRLAGCPAAVHVVVAEQPHHAGEHAADGRV
jgi:hypothetical protein